MTYDIWGIQAIAGQAQSQPQAHSQAGAPPPQFIGTLYEHFAACAAPAAPESLPAPRAFVFPHLREVNHVDLSSFASKKKVHRYIA